jgi:phosphoribosylanthranilate isomerase
VWPFGVDVSSGVEGVPGVKDPAKILEFVKAARAAAAGLETDI